MQFCIAETSYFDSLGFNTEHWRKSVDGSKSVVHYDTVGFFVNENQVQILRHDDEAFKSIMMSPEWVGEEEDGYGEI